MDISEDGWERVIWGEGLKAVLPWWSDRQRERSGEGQGMTLSVRRRVLKSMLNLTGSQ